jgi:hypothetical protein
MTYTSTSTVRIAIIVSLAGQAVPLLFHLEDLFSLLISLFSYIYYWPIFFQVFSIYSISRMDDFTVGLKARDEDDNLQALLHKEREISFSKKI